MNLTNIDNEKSRRTLENDPQYFGGFFNLARLNIFNINNHLAEQLKQATLPQDGKIVDSLLCGKGKSTVNPNQLFEKLLRFMPVVKLFDAERLPKEVRTTSPKEGKDIRSMYDTMEKVFTDFQGFRNDYTHYLSTETGTERKINVSDKTAAFLNDSFRLAIAYTQQRMAGVLADEDYSLVNRLQLVTGPDNRISTEGVAFLTCMFLDREQAFRFISKVKGLKGTQFKSFIATREVLMTYCVKLPHDKLISDDPKQALMLDMLNELNRCPKQLFHVIADEGKKTYLPQLTDEGIEQILANSFSDEEKENALDGWDYSNYVEELTRRIRHDDRFHYFALRFIEQMGIFDKLHFQLNLGKYQLRSYPKQLLGQPETRDIVENVKAFGTLSQYTDEATVTGLVDPHQLGNGFEQFAPGYLMQGNKIGLSTLRSTAKVEAHPGGKYNQNLVQPQPLAFLSLHELSKIILLEYLSPGAAQHILLQFIRFSEEQLFDRNFIEEVKKQLPAWPVFYKQTDVPRKRLRAYATKAYPTERKEALNRVLAPYGIDDKQVPERLYNYWLNIADVKEERSVADRIKAMKRDGMTRLRALENHRTNPEVTIPKVGEMASFLARDIVDMVIDPKKKAKITSFYYDKLQQCLALYADAEKRQLFEDIVVSELKLNEPDGHPFLRELPLWKITRTSELYRLYLQEKTHKMVREINKFGKPVEKDQSWMQKTFYLFNRDTRKTDVMIPTHRGQIPYSIRQWDESPKYSLDQWLAHCTQGKARTDRAKPVDLPTNLLDEALTDCLRERLTAQGLRCNETDRYNELLKRWWKHFRQDDVQPVYKAKRSYLIAGQTVEFVPDSCERYADYYNHDQIEKAFRQRLAERKGAQKKELKYEEQKQLKRGLHKLFISTLGNTEREIRITAEEDRLMLLMAEQLLGGSETLKLRTIHEELNKTRTVTQQIPLLLNYDEKGEYKEGKARPQATITIRAERKLKNFSELYRYRHDRRLPELAAYYPGQEIDLEDLRTQLAGYDDARLLVFDSVFRLEAAIAATDAAALKALYTQRDGSPKTRNIQHRPYLDWLRSKALITEADYSFLEMVRNCFSHNQFPYHPTASSWVQFDAHSPLAMQVARVYEQKMEALIEKISTNNQK